MSRLSRSIPLVLAAALPLGLGGCDDSPKVQVLEKEVSDLRSLVKKTESERDRLAGRLDQMERRLAGLQEDLLAVHKSAQTASAAAPETAGDGPTVEGAPVAGAPTDPRAAQAAKDLGEILSTEDGRRVFESAMRAYEQKREQERTARMAQGMVDAFAQRANLSPQQKEKMQEIASRAMAEIGGVWRSMRDQEMTPEERATRRQEAVAKMEEVRQRTDEEVKTILDASQWDLYQQESARMRGFMGGLGGGMDGGGGFGGRRGQ